MNRKRGVENGSLEIYDNNLIFGVHAHCLPSGWYLCQSPTESEASGNRS